MARQTKSVGGTQAQGSADAEANANDIIATFGGDSLALQGSSFFVFLDVEGVLSLSQAYYADWATPS